MKVGLVVIFSTLLINVAQSQQNKLEKNRYHFSGVFGIARSKFEISGVPTEDYPTLEMRLGGGISRTLGSKLKIKSGLNICLRTKRKSYLINGNYYGRGIPLLLLDETASKQNHFAIELPLYLNYSLNSVTNINAGFMGRFWQPTNLDGDILKSTKEIGFIAGAERRIFPQWTFGIQFYFGISRLITGYLVGPTNYVVKNRFAQLTLEYTF